MRIRYGVNQCRIKHLAMAIKTEGKSEYRLMQRLLLGLWLRLECSLDCISGSHVSR